MCAADTEELAAARGWGWAIERRGRSGHESRWFLGWDAGWMQQARSHCG